LIPHQSSATRGRDPERQFDAFAEDLSAKVARRPIVKKARAQLDPLKCRPVLLKRNPVLGALVDVFEDAFGQAALRNLAQIEDVVSAI